MALAALSFLLLLLFGALAGFLPQGIWLIGAAFFYAHAVFIAAVAWKQVRPSETIFRCARSPGLAAGALLVLPILMFALLDGIGASYACAEGAARRTSAIPNIPWLWIGWAVLTATAFPARCIGLATGEAPRLVPIGRRLLPMAAFVPPILLFGAPFQRHVPNCSPPFDGMGLFEGGAVVLPLLGLFWFILSFSMGALSGAFVEEDRPE
jgi:hypothetical protein